MLSKIKRRRELIGDRAACLFTPVACRIGMHTEGCAHDARCRQLVCWCQGYVSEAVTWAYHEYRTHITTGVRSAKRHGAVWEDGM